MRKATFAVVSTLALAWHTAATAQTATIAGTTPPPSTVSTASDPIPITPPPGNATPPAAPTQSAPTPPLDNGTGVADIIVTAQKRSESIQSVPIAISAFTQAALQERAVGNVSAIANITPNVTLDAGTPFSGSTSVLAAYIRGIGSDDFAFNIDPAVGVYLDGVYLARSVGANQDLLDVDRVEVLKGPQGTLFGRNTIGGAISIVTRTPGDVLRVVGDVTGGSYRLAKLRVSGDLPIADGLTSNITAGVTTRQGYMRRLGYPDQRTGNTTAYSAFVASDYDSSRREGGESSRVFRAKLHFDRNTGFRDTVSADFLDTDDSGLPNTLLATLEKVPLNFAGTTNLPGTAFDPTGTTGFNFAGLYNFCIASTPTQIAARGATALCGARGTQYRPASLLPGFGSVNVDANPNNNLLPFDSRFITGDKDTTYATGNNFSKLRSYGFSNIAEFDISRGITVKSITAYRNLNWRSGQDADGSPLNILQLSFDERQHQVSQEVQLIGSNLLDRKLNFVLGGYYFSEGGSLHDYVTFDEGLLQVDGPNSFFTRNYAFFGQADYRPIPLIGVTLGGRYTDESKEFEGGQLDLNGFNYKLFGCSDANGNITPNGAFPLAPVTCQQGLGYPDPTNPIRVYPPGLNKLHFTNFSPKVGIQLHPAERVMVYGSWSRGYKTGGWTTRFTNPQPAAASFAPETASTFEIGVKTQLFDRRLQLNAAAFTTDYQGIQLNFQQGTSPTIRNAGNARIKGFEVEAVVAPAQGLTLNASVGYLDAYYTSVLPGVQAVSGADAYQAGTFAGADLPKTPHWKINVSPRYAMPLGNGGTLVFLGDYTHQSSSWNDAQRVYLLRRNASDILNASISYQAPGGHWTLTAGGTNIANVRVLTTGGIDQAAGLIYGTYNRPAEWYARLGFKF